MPENWILILAVAALVLLVLFRRARRLLARQRFSEVRIVLRLGLIGVICALLFVLLSLTRGLVPAMGLAAGGLLGLLGAALARFEVADDHIDFIPNGWLGTGVLVLFLGRIVYRLTLVDKVELASSGAPFGGAENLVALRQMSSPWTVAILFVLLGYYLGFYTAVLVRGRALKRSAALPDLRQAVLAPAGDEVS